MPNLLNVCFLRKKICFLKNNPQEQSTHLLHVSQLATYVILPASTKKMHSSWWMFHNRHHHHHHSSHFLFFADQEKPHAQRKRYM